uniref:Uncharacterized protein n=1 Tax=Coccolithus braarudii TaxID=221442 RepID=A0A7S0L7P8_9EUKA|mmetsp:Transcript_22163/g.47873  ORF Transcript_22163/g.47873 Transcript_22163/m.47873 type:complete len:430 (+) Transcript_22163:799-2088(+)
MAPWLELPAIEAFVRSLLSARSPPPVIIVLQISDWCRGSLRGSDKWARTAAEELRVCQHYGITCLSPREALEPLVQAREVSSRDIAGRRRLATAPAAPVLDCLHPVNSRGMAGVKLISMMLVNALVQARAQTRQQGVGPLLRSSSLLQAEAQRGVATRVTSRARGRALPTNLHAVNAAIGARKHAKCFSLSPTGFAGTQRVVIMPWQTSWCADDEASVRRAPRRQPLGEREGCATLAHDVAASSEGSWRRTAVGWGGGIRQPSCPSLEVPQTEYQAFLTHPPTRWMWCEHSLSPQQLQRKISPGVVALKPGSVLDLLLPDEGERGASTLRATLVFLRSYEGMGRVSLNCIHACSCAPELLDGHEVNQYVNASGFAEHEWEINLPAASQHDSPVKPIGAAQPLCAIRLRILSSTSSGGYKFKVRQVRLTY